MGRENCIERDIVLGKQKKCNTRLEIAFTLLIHRSSEGREGFRDGNFSNIGFIHLNSFWLSIYEEKIVEFFRWKSQ